MGAWVGGTAAVTPAPLPVPVPLLTASSMPAPLPLPCCLPLPACPQAVPLASKKASHVGKSSESPAALLQLPHFDGEVLRKLARKKVKALPGGWWVGRCGLGGIGVWGRGGGAGRMAGQPVLLQCRWFRASDAACCTGGFTRQAALGQQMPATWADPCGCPCLPAYLPAELQQLAAEERQSVLAGCGLSSSEVDEVETMLSGGWVGRCSKFVPC